MYKLDGIAPGNFRVAEGEAAWPILPSYGRSYWPPACLAERRLTAHVFSRGVAGEGPLDRVEVRSAKLIDNNACEQEKVEA
jgi:hypothetical protein